MKLDNEVVQLVQRAMKTAQVLKFDSFVIEQGLVRGWNEAHTAIMVHTDVPELPFNGIGIARIPALVGRFNLMENFTVEADLANNFVMSLTLKNANTTVKYRCANPNAIKSPKTLKDREMWTMEISPTLVAQLNRAKSAMGAENVLITSKDGNCVLKMSDMNRDEYEQKFDGYIENVGGISDSTDFSFHYNLEMFLTAIKYSEEAKDVEGEKGSVKLVIGQSGSFLTKINGLTVSIPPEAIL